MNTVKEGNKLTKVTITELDMDMVNVVAPVCQLPQAPVPFCFARVTCISGGLQNITPPSHALASRVVLRPTLHTKIKHRIKEVVKLIVTRGIAVEESRGATPRVMFFLRTSAQKVPNTPRPHNQNVLHAPFAAAWPGRALESTHRCISDVDKILRSGGRTVESE
ncbi:hypothetical protein EDB83DRAFT_2310804 [Lactarius deliciosus]|nr:hypothetical protein EDB83DRAFT_2310804 [Lactarius deliciosus]